MLGLLVVKLYLLRNFAVVFQVSMEGGSNIERNVLLSRWIIQDCAMKRKYYYTMPRMNNIFVSEKKEVFEYYLVVMKISYF